MASGSLFIHFITKTQHIFHFLFFFDAWCEIMYVNLLQKKTSHRYEVNTHQPPVYYRLETCISLWKCSTCQSQINKKSLHVFTPQWNQPTSCAYEGLMVHNDMQEWWRSGGGGGGTNQSYTARGNKRDVTHKSDSLHVITWSLSTIKII